MVKPKSSDLSYLRPALARVSKLHILLAVAFGIQIAVYDAWKLITPEIVMKRWVLAGILFITATVVWYIAKQRSEKTLVHKALWALIIIDIAIISYLIYLSRGMASRAVILYAIPILTSGILLKRSPILLTACLSIILYVVTAVAYFKLNFNEGYKIELYGEISLYSVVLLIIGLLLWAVLKTKKN